MVELFVIHLVRRKEIFNMAKIKNDNGKVTYVMRTGKTFVKSTMALAYAQAIVNRGQNVEETDLRGCGIEICVDDKYFFPVEPETEPVKARKKKSLDEVTE